MTTTIAALDPAGALSVLRTAVGAGTWIHPGLSWRTFGFGPIPDDPRTVLISRMFGIRDLGLGLAVRHPSPPVRRAALQVGIALDVADVAASVIAVRRGAPATILLGVTAGAAFFVGLGLAALNQDSSAA